MKGVLLFAFNNERVDYVRLSLICGARANRLWDLPICVVSDVPKPARLPHGFVFWRQVDQPSKVNSKSYYDYGTALSFWNTNRHQALELTPFSETILMDTDLMINTTSIVDAWDGHGVKLSRTAYSADGVEFGTDIKFLSQKTRLPMYWATIVCFDHSPVAKEFFGWWLHVAEHYATYSHLFGFPSGPFRNDFAASVALEIMKGTSQSDFFDLPYAIPTLQPGSKLTSLDPLTVSVIDQNDDTDTNSSSFTLCTDAHVMNKKSILDCVKAKTNK